MDPSLGGHDGPKTELDAAVRGALLTPSPIALHLLSSLMQQELIKTAARHLRAFPLDDAMGRHPSEWAGDFYSGAFETMLRDVLNTGVAVLDVEARGHLTPAAPETVLSISTFRLEDPAGGVLGVMAAIVDITGQQRAVARLELLERASGHIGTTLNIFRTAQEFADEMVPTLADVVAVEVLDSVLRGEVSAPGAVFEHGALRCTGVSSCVPEPPGRLPAIGEAIGLMFGTPFSQSLSDLRPRLVADLTAGSGWPNREAVRGRRMLEAGAHSLLVLPLAARGAVLGVAHCYRNRTPGAFDEDDLALASELADRVALCLDNARLYT
ncbi:PAS domain-containing protein, partial [Streptomyces sp. NPDC127574]|uniref:PAS domain-containing protein n=1 Tax=Streptomyces sp. NPDC127574 TaxID=3345401 RepID=UPI00363D3FA6